MSESRLSLVDLSFFLLFCFIAYKFVFSRPCTTRLPGPPRQNIFLGSSKALQEASDSALLYEQWAAEYGPVYSVATPFGTSRTVLCDPKAIAHFYAKEGFGYVKLPTSRAIIKAWFGRNVLWAEGEMHRRQRRSLAPAFSNAAIRSLTSVFFDSAYKMASNWDAVLESSADGSQVIEVQKWMNGIALDSIGIAGFSYDFRSLEGVPTVLDSVNFASGAAFFGLIIMISSQIPMAMKIPNKRNSMMKQLKVELSNVADQLLKKGKEGGLEHDKSMIGQMLKAETPDSEYHMAREDVIAQMSLLLLAGYETTSISLTWCLIELCRNQGIQDRLRDELSQFTSDPTYEQLTSALPYLDAVVHETLRTHPPLEETTRVAAEDDVVPLSAPIKTKKADTVTSIFVAKGSVITIPIRALNRSEEIWGPDAKTFNPERWLVEDALSPKNAIQGHRHLLTFIDGPRTCLGKQFAIVEFKAALSVLIRKYKFEFEAGKEDMEIGKFPSLIDRPKKMSADGPYVPLRVRHV